MQSTARVSHLKQLSVVGKGEELPFVSPTHICAGDPADSGVTSVLL